MFVVFALLLFIFQVRGEAFQIAENCTYFREIHVNNLYGTQLYDLTVSVKFDNFVGKTDCYDYVLHENGEPADVHVPFFLESSCNSITNRIWWNVPSIGPFTLKTYYFYYGCENQNDTYMEKNDWVLMSIEPCPTGYTRFATMDGKLLRIGQEFSANSWVSTNHDHVVQGGDFVGDPLSTNGNWNNNGALTSQTSHDHTWNQFTTTMSNNPLPPLITVYFCEGNNLDIFNGSIIANSEQIPSSSQYQIFYEGDGRMFMGSDTPVGQIGGSETHTHRAIGQSEPGDEDENDTGGSDVSIAKDAHIHDFDDLIGPANNLPPFRAFHTWMAMGDSVEVSDTGFYLSTSNTPPLGYAKVSGEDAFLMSTNLRWAYDHRGGSVAPHTHYYIGDARKVNLANQVQLQSGTGGKSSIDHEHEMEFTTDPAVVGIPEHVNLTLFYRLPSAIPGIQVYMGSEKVFTTGGSTGYSCTPPCVNGFCADQDYCLCSSGYDGPVCDNPMCNNVQCGPIERAACTAPDICECAPGWMNPPLCEDRIPDPPGLDPTLFIVFGSLGVVFVLATLIIIIIVVLVVSIYYVLQVQKKKRTQKELEVVNIEVELLSKQDEEMKKDEIKREELKKELVKLKEEEERLKSVRIDVPEIPLRNVKKNEEVFAYEMGKGYKGSYNNETVLIRSFKKSIFFNQKINVYGFMSSEIELCSFVHPNILRNFAYFQFGIVSEYTPYLLKNYIEDRTKRFKLADMIKVLFEIGSGCLFLHRKKISMKNLNIGNIFLTEALKPKIDYALCDFMKVNPDNLYYSAPEIVLKQTKPEEKEEEDDEDQAEEDKFQYKCDVFSYGMIMFCMLRSTSDPYKVKNKTNGIGIKIAKDPKYRPSLGRDVSRYPNWFVNLMNQCLSHNPMERPSFARIQMIISTIMGNEEEEEEGEDEGEKQEG